VCIYANEKFDDVISGHSFETNDKIKNFSGKNGLRN